MIVICTKCNAKFRVADEKIPLRGAKVRCSRCQSVFLVHPDLGTMPLDPPRAARANVAVEPAIHAAPPAAPPALEDDPFAAAAAAPAAPPAVGFAEQERAPFPADDDPFAAASALPAPPQEPRAALPVTDLSDLLAPAPAKSSPPPIPPPLPPPLPARDGPIAFDDDMLAPTPGAALGGVASDPFAESADGGLALEDRLTPPPTRVPILGAGAGELAEPSFAEPMAFEGPAASIDPFAEGAEAAHGGELPLADDRLSSPPVAPPPSAPTPLARIAPVPAPVPDERIPGRRGSRTRSAVVSVVSLLVIVFVAAGFLAAWRAEGPLEPRSFHPAAVIATLRRDGAPAAPFAARDVRSGVYERARAAPLLFVRGTAVSRAPAPVAAVKVSVEIVRAGQVVARGEAVAGALPTAEELHGARDSAALAAVAQRAAARAPRQVKPGDAVPFLVAIGDAPADLEGASLRVEVAPVRRARP